jgi:hypothetical protein
METTSIDLNRQNAFVDPVEHLTSEARRLWPDRTIGCLVSLGTGVRVPQGFNSNKSRLHEVLQSLADIATDANTKAREFRDTREGRELVWSSKYSVQAPLTSTARTITPREEAHHGLFSPERSF